MMLQAMLGMRVLGFERRVVFDTHLMPAWLEWLSIDGSEGRRRQRLVRVAPVP